jgi:mannose-6-phosphate isomerase-like protein (cupin superfamily)
MRSISQFYYNDLADGLLPAESDLTHRNAQADQILQVNGTAACQPGTSHARSHPADPRRRNAVKRDNIFTLAAASLLFAASSGITGAAAQAADPTSFASGTEVQAQVRTMLAEMKPDQGFMWRPLVRDGKTAAIEIWKKPGRPAVHPAEAEYAIVIEGSGTLVSGGALADAKTSNPGLVEGSRIEGGTTRTLGPGDVILVPAGVPHWFGITGERLVLLGIKLPGAK